MPSWCAVSSLEHSREEDGGRAEAGRHPRPPTWARSLKRPDVHGVIITTPSGAHMEPAVAAASAGKHVVVEKPLEITLTRCDRIIDACEKNNVQLCTIFPSRFGDANVELKKAVDAGRFGRLTLGETTCKWWRPQSYYDEGGWKGTQALDGGGRPMNQAIHNVDLLLWMMGPVRASPASRPCWRTSASRSRTPPSPPSLPERGAGRDPGDDERPPGLPKTIAVHGDQGIGGHRAGRRPAPGLHPRDGGRPRGEVAFRRQKVGASGGASDPRPRATREHRRQLADFAAAVQDNWAPRSMAAKGEGGRSHLCDLRKQPDRERG